MALAGMRKGTAAGLALLVGFATLIPPPATARWAAEQWNFDIVGYSASPCVVAPGGSVTLTVSIQNVGGALGTVHVYAGIEPPSGPLGRQYLGPNTIYNIPVGQTMSTSWTYTPSGGPGQYLIDFDVYSPPENHMFDTTGFVSGFTVSGAPHDPMATRSSPSSSAVSLKAGDTQTFAASLSDADCDLNYAEWYLAGAYKATDSTPAGRSASTSWTHTFDSEGTFNVTVVVYDDRNQGNHVGRASWNVVVGPASPVGNPCVISGASLTFSGYQWEIRPDGQGGPGGDDPVNGNGNGNTWKANNVSCDDQGHLHLKVRQQNGIWTTAQVATTARFGFGHYEFKVAGDKLDRLDPNVVLGLFNYPPPDVGPDGTNEIDIEFSKWGDATRQPGQYVVYPANPNLAYQFERQTFPFTQTETSTTHHFDWQNTRVDFESLQGGQQFAQWTDNHPLDYASRIPQNPLPVYINLWLYCDGPSTPCARAPSNALIPAPSNGLPTEIVIESFSWNADAVATSASAQAALPPPPLPPLH
jgi:hypothetical protein